MKKNLANLFVIYVCMISLSAFDLSGSLHVDTFSGSHNVGFSFFAEENIIPKLAMRAEAEYLTAREYDIQILGVVRLSPVTLGGGFALEVTKNPQLPISPGMGLLFGWQATKNFAMETSAIVAFTPEDLGKLHDIRVKMAFFYNTDNVNTDFSYKIKKGIATSDFINTLAFQVEAFEQGVPVGLVVGADSDIFIDTEGLGLMFSVVGGLNVYTEKYGTYFATTKIGLLSSRTDTTPYEITAGARFSL